MDAQIKTGNVYFQRRKAGKKWKPVWLSLFPPSNSSVGRLEIQLMGGGAAGGDFGSVGKRHHGDKNMKVIRLSELISVQKLPPNAEACPEDNMSAFCVETEERTLVFAALKDDCVEWVEKLCQSSFQRDGISGSSPSQFHMEENQIYASADEVSNFWVVVQRTDAAARCGLQGAYWLQAGQEALVLRETQTKNTVREWPYHLLRRYGNDKLTLTIEAGRRCGSGPGTFIFETQQADKIFSLIQKTIKQKTSSKQSQDDEKVVLSKSPARSPLPKIPEMASMSAILENKLRMEVKKSAGSDETEHAQKDLVSPSQSAPVKPAPITLLPLPDLPTTHDTLPTSVHLVGQSEALYADPDVCIRSVPKVEATHGVYMDPAMVLPLKPPFTTGESVTRPPHFTDPHSSSNIDSPDSIYSEVFDKISPMQNKQNVIQSQVKVKCFADDEPQYIYTEPMHEMDGASQKSDTKPDPFAHLYAQVCKTKPSSVLSSSSGVIPSSSASSSSVPTTMDTDISLSDVIYENLGII
ncbi:hypothetical protein LDENG_00225750 [Lucifuga dentata]|nr:hypothetical protein LDENG_00225750 [Lucifuga dentata]